MLLLSVNVDIFIVILPFAGLHLGIDKPGRSFGLGVVIAGLDYKSSVSYQVDKICEDLLMRER